ncbi:hypothetical protein LTR66_016106 [Elasticomyces elasticus]|nr:hypothetical protein LTR66_016106 [Elasticomyces elasticus]
MSDAQKGEIPAGANDSLKELKDSAGNSFRVKAADYDINEKPTGEAHQTDASGPKFTGQSVYWTTGSSGNTTTDVSNKTSITWYKLGKAPWYSPYTWELTINCTDTYDFEFHDESGDKYELNVYLNSGSHYVQYSSGQPTITSIDGS